MSDKNLRIEFNDIIALEKVFELIKEFLNKNPIKKSKINIDRIYRKINALKSGMNQDKQSDLNIFQKILKKFKSIIGREINSKIFYLVGGHGGIIIDDIGFCEFDSPVYAMNRLVEQMELGLENKIPYNLEIAVSCHEWIKNNNPELFSKFISLFRRGSFEIINPTYSQPYSLLIGAESNVKQIEYGLKTLKNLGLECNVYYSSEMSVHPQIPQLLKGFEISYCSLRTRLLGTCPSSHSGCIYWEGLDGSKIPTLTDQSGIYNGEYFHGTFYQEIPNLLFQAVSRPFIKNLIFSSIEDFIMPLAFQEDVWKISGFLELFGKFCGYSELFKLIKTDGEFKYTRDNFSLGEYIFLQNDLFLNNKNCEIAIISAEIVNFVIGQFEQNSEDRLFEDLWKKLLHTQAHDNYAVPFVQPGDYAAQQLDKEIYDKLEISPRRVSISKLSLEMQKDIQKSCWGNINENLRKIGNQLIEPNKKEEKANYNFLIFNPTIYPRKDMVSILLKTNDRAELQLYNDTGKPINYVHEDSVIKFIATIPPIGYKIYSLKSHLEHSHESKFNFYYDLTISHDKKAINISFNGIEIYKMSFTCEHDYNLILNIHEFNNIEDKRVILGKIKNQDFRLEIFQYNDVNRLDFVLHSKLIKEIRIEPNFDVLKSLVNYPFGVEETKRSDIQTLDFLWLIGTNQSLLYTQKNSQKFLIDRDTFEFRNKVPTNGRYEFSISILDNAGLSSVIKNVTNYKFKLLGVQINDNCEFSEKSYSFMPSSLPVSLVNLWRRGKDFYMRLWNASNEEIDVNLEQLPIKSSLVDIDFNYKIKNKIKNKKITMTPWNIKTIQFGD